MQTHRTKQQYFIYTLSCRIAFFYHFKVFFQRVSGFCSKQNISQNFFLFLILNLSQLYAEIELIHKFKIILKFLLLGNLYDIYIYNKGIYYL